MEIIKTGKPLTHKMISLTTKNGTSNHRVRIGTPVSRLIDTDDGGKLIVNGPMRGYTLIDAKYPIMGNMDSIYLQTEKDLVLSRNNQCINCGKCVNVCPVNLDVNLICRYSEFSLYEKSLEIGGSDCIECGLCAYYCPAGRSLVQLIRLAKSEAEKIKGEDAI